MNDVEERFAIWRAEVRERGRLGDEEVEELEGHLRDEVETLVASGCSPSEAVGEATARLGSVVQVGNEFGKVRIPRIVRERLVWMLGGYVAIEGCQLVARLVATVASRWPELPQWLGVGSMSTILVAIYAALIGVLVFAVIRIVLSQRTQSTRHSQWARQLLRSELRLRGLGSAVLIVASLVGFVGVALAIDYSQWWARFQNSSAVRSAHVSSYWIERLEMALAPSLAVIAIVVIRRGLRKSWSEFVGPGHGPHCL